MGCDILVALGRATVDQQTLFGLNSHHHARQPQVLCRVPGREFAAGEVIRTPTLELPQARQTFTVLASRFQGRWGYEYGVNEHQVAIGYSNWHSLLATIQPILLASDLVRLTLERCRTARQGLELVGDLLIRHGHSVSIPHGGDAIFLLADPTEAFVLEAAGAAWSCQEIQMVRAVSDVSVIRQDWDRINRGLADEVIQHGWWQCDGSKLDFSGTLSVDPTGRASALRRWDRATLLLEQQNGHLDEECFRRILADHYEGARYEFDPITGTGLATPLCRHPTANTPLGTVSSFVATLTPNSPVRLAWCAFGPPCLCVHFPVFLDGDLPEALTNTNAEGPSASLWWRTCRLLETLERTPARWRAVRETMGQLQGQLEQEADEFRAQAADLKQRDASADLSRQANLLMQSHVERYETILEALAAPGAPAGVALP